ncbi:transporter substrate-binding domain-containing protein [Peribacillus loiseleuriae]|uniref:transporter substrate-binding domain-containing protein n=1 Tax=Peribacillus loiseleuriae TaxID=1679170 RepID=UPI003D02FA1D
MKSSKQLMLMFVMIMMIGILAACGTSNNDDSASDKESASGDGKKVLIMGTSADYPPFEYVETAKSDDIIGFDIDVAKAITEKLGYEFQVKDIDFNGLVPSLENGSVDFVLSGMSPTAERKKTVDFSDIYYKSNHMIVTKADGKIKDVKDLNGATVGVQLASIQEGIAKDLKKDGIDLTIENRNRIPDIVQEIKAGRFDAAIIEDTVAKGYLADNPDLAGYVIDGKTKTEEAGSAIAFQKDSELTEKFNNELKKMMENGEMEKLILKWFSGEPAK